MLDILATAVSGMQEASRRLEASANRVAKLGMTAPTPGPGAGPSADLAAESVAQVTAKLDFLLDLKAVEASTEMVRRLYEATD